MRIEIWTDIICPWCGLGEHRLKEALRRFGHAGDIEIVRRSFQLDERAPMGSTESVRQMLATKKGLPPAHVETMTKRIEELARSEGLTPYVVADNRVGNTSLAHELAAWATEQGRGAEMWARLYTAYFGEARDVFAVEPLVALAAELGLDPDAARETLESRRYQARVLADGAEARKLGASGVPFFVIDRKYGIAGAQPVDALVKVLTTALESTGT